VKRRILSLSLIWFFTIFFLIAVSHPAQKGNVDEYDVLIKNGRVLDGSLKPAFRADIVILDLKNIKIKTSISNPHQYSEGIKYLLINGKVVLFEGKWNGNLPGKVLKLKKS